MRDLVLSVRTDHQDMSHVSLSHQILEQVPALKGFSRAEILRTSPDQPGAPDGFFAAKLIRV